MESNGNYLWRKTISWLLILCLAVTMIPDIGYGAESERKEAPMTEPADVKQELSQKDIVEKTEVSTTYDMGNGQRMSVFHGGEVRFKDEKGNLMDYDPSLVKIKNGEKTENLKSLKGYEFKNNKGDEKQYMPEVLSEKTPVVMEKDGHEITIAPADETSRMTDTEGEKVKAEKETQLTIYEEEKELPVNAVYGDKDNGAQIAYTSEDHGIKETLTLYRKPESNIFRYVLDTGGLKAKKNTTDEGITIYDEATEEIIAAIAPPWMNDAGGDAYSEEVTYELEEDKDEKGRYIITMTVDEEYLSDEKRQYPVTIDPTTTWTGDSKVKDVYVISGSTYGKMNFYDSGTVVMPAGKNSKGTYETYIQFVNLKSSIAKKNITGATFNTYEVSGGAKGQKISIYRAAKSWAVTKLTYSNRPGSTGSALASVASTKTAKKLHTFNVTSYVKGVAAGSMSDYGLVLKNTTSSPSYAAFYGSRSGTTSCRPNLKVTYTEGSSTASDVKLSKSYTKDSTDVSLTYKGFDAADIARVEYKITKYDDVKNTETETVSDFDASKTVKSGSKLPFLKEGCYKVYIRGVNKSGTAGQAVAAGTIHVDTTIPAFASVTLKDSAGKPITPDAATAENNPIIEFKEVTDSHIGTPFITYAVTAKGMAPADGDFKNPAELNVNSAKPYTGIFRLAEADRKLPSGAYTLHVKFRDLAGNEAVKKLSYQKDFEDPSGSITISDVRTGNELKEISEPVNIKVTVDGTGSEIAESSLELYRCSGTGASAAIVKESKQVLAKNFTEGKNIVFDTLNICESSGQYRLVLKLKDSVGRTKEITKDVTVAYRLPAPEVKLNASTGGTAELTWSFRHGLQQNIRAGRIMGKFGENGTWQELVPSGADGTIDFEGTAQITVPETEGTTELYVKGVGSDGVEGPETKVMCVVDRTAPQVVLSDVSQGCLTGLILDENLDEWKTYVKEKGESEYPKEPYGTGNNEVGYLDEEDIKRGCEPIYNFDISKAPFEPGKTYAVKIVAEDRAGNTAEKTIEFTVPLKELLPRFIPAQLEIEKKEGSQYDKAFIVGTDQTVLKLKGNVQGALWYINNHKTSPELKDQDGNMMYDEFWWNDVVALKKEGDGSRKYSVDRTENGLKEEISYRDDEITGNTGEKFVTFFGDAVSFRIETEDKDAVYQVKSEATGEENYVTVEPGKTYYVEEISGTAVFSRSFSVKAAAGKGKDIHDLKFTMYAEGITNEAFLYSEVEKYAPENLTVEDKINYKTYLRWDGTTELPENISYEVHRSTEEDFWPDETTLAATDIKTNYFVEMNIDYGKDYYYKVCAVKKFVDDTGAYNEVQSNFTQVMASRAVDQNEFVKRLGTKEFWEFTDFDTPNGNGSIEKSKGNFLYQQKDAEIPNEGFDVVLTRAYNSQSSSKSVFGTGWSHDYDMELLNICENNSAEFNHVVLKDGNGTIYHFTRNKGENHYVSSLGSYVNLVAETEEKTKTVNIAGGAAGGKDNTVNLKYKFVLTTKDGLAYFFNSGGQLILMEEGNGNFVLFEHDKNKGLLSGMVTNNNVAVNFIYNDGSDGSDPLTVKEITMPDGSRVEYEYTKPVFSSERLLTKVTEVSGEERIEYEYEYDKPIFSSQIRNLTCIRDAENKNKYEIKYDFERDQVEEAVYPNGEKFAFDYTDNNTATVTKKYSGGEAVLGEKDEFDRVSGACEKSIRGVTDMDRLQGGSEEGLDVTTYEYRNDLLVSSKSTAEYFEIGSDGYITEKKDVKEEKASYSGGKAVRETDDEGTVSEYTYYTEEDGEHLDDLVKTEQETNAEGRLVAYKKYSYDSVGNVTETVDYIAETKIVNTYYTEGSFKGELKTVKEYLITVKDKDTITDESLKSIAEYVYECKTAEGSSVKVEKCTQTIPRPDGGNEVISTETQYDVMGREVRETDSRGYETTYTYDGFGRNTKTAYKYSSSDRLKQDTAKTYDRNGMVTYEKVEDGIEKWYTYDDMGRVIKTKVKKGDSHEEIINTDYRYQDIEVYRGKGSDTVHVSNAYVTKQTYADGTIISETYEDNFGNTVRAYEGGLYTDMTYNSQGELITKWSMGQTLSAADGVLELYIYDNKGNLTATAADPGYSEKAGTTGYYIRKDSQSEDGKIIQGTVLSSTKYDADGNAVEQTDAVGNTTKYTYDRNGDLTSVLLPDSTKYEYQYDIKGENNTTEDVVIEPKQIKTGDTVTETTGRSVVVKDATDRTIRIEDLGVKEHDDTSISTSYEYDTRDNLIKATEKEGNYKTYSYDERNRVTSIDYYEKQGDNSVRTLKTEFTYDDADNLTSMTDKKIKEGKESIYRYTAYEYDGFNRLLSVAECDTDKIPDESELKKHRISYTYDGKDRLEEIDYPDCSLGVKGLKFNYNIHGWLMDVKAVDKSGSDKLLREYTYTDDGKVGEIKDYTDFLKGTDKWIKRTYFYDRLNRTTGIEYTDSMTGSSKDLKEAHYYEYDKNSSIVREATVNNYGTANGAVYAEIKDYTYDSRNRLVETYVMKKSDEENIIEENRHFYQYDTAGNKIQEYTEKGRHDYTTIDYAYNEFNQIVTMEENSDLYGLVQDKKYTYDDNGNQIKEIDNSTGKETTYEYDADNRLIYATAKNGSEVEYTQENQYNGFGQRVEKTEGENTTEYYYDGTAVLYTKDKADKVTSFNLIGAEDNILTTARAGEEGNTDFYTYTKDLRESTINLVGADGKAVRSYSYDDYGKTSELGAGEFYNEVCYSGGIYDDTTGLYYLNARYYSPDTGNFMTQDTYRGSRLRTETLNLYGYCAGNPINYTDPSGHAIWGIVGAALGAYDGYKYAKKKNLKGWKKYAAIGGGAVLGAINPLKILKYGKKGIKAAGKLYKKARSAYKKSKTVKKVKAKPKKTVVAKKNVKAKTKVSKAKKSTKVVKKTKKTVSKNVACFTAGTKIHTKDGFKNIEAIKMGDYVWSENPETHEKALKKVKKIFVREKDSIVRLSINGESIETTNEHPFYVEGKGWINAYDLKAGDKVRQEDGSTDTVEETEHIELKEPVTVYNFEVEDFHTYYVSEQKVLVHNTCAKPNKAAPPKVNKTTKTTSTPKSNAIVSYYPNNNGAVEGSKKMVHLMPGDKIDRYGDESGRFFAPTNTPHYERSLPYDTDLSQYHVYEVVKPLQVEESIIAPAFGQPGGGVQYRSAVIVEILLKRGIIKEIGR